MNLLNVGITGATSATATQPIRLNGAPRNVTVQANFVYGSGGTTVDVYLQTTLDSGNTWADIAEFHFTTASARKAYNLNSQTPETTAIVLTDGAMAANTAQDGILGPQLRAKYTSTGTYAGGTNLAIDVQSDQLASYP